MRSFKQLLLYISFFLMNCQLFGGITVSPKQIFLNTEKKMIPLTVRCTDASDYEVTITILYAYVTSNDSGKSIIYSDSFLNEENSASQWIRAYPNRFILGDGQNQMVRLIASPPTDIKEGEYWARVMVTSVPRKKLEYDKKSGQSNSGIVFSQAIGLPIYYRHGKVETGLLSTDNRIQLNGKILFCAVDLKRTGNASFNGTKTIRVLDKNDRIIKNISSTLTVFKNFAVKEWIDLSDLPVDDYKVEIEFTSKRRDMELSKILQTVPLRFSSVITLR